MEVEQFLDSIGIEARGNSQDDAYVIDIADAADYAKIYSTLDNSSDVELDENSVNITEESADLFYDGKEYTCELIGDLKNDKYRLVVSRI